MNKRIGGVCYIALDGEQLELAGKMSVSLNKMEREGTAGMSGHVNFKEKPKVPYVEGEFMVPQGFPMDKVLNRTDLVVTVELANGMNGLLSPAWHAGDFELDAAEGTVSLRFEGGDGRWI